MKRAVLLCSLAACAAPSPAPVARPAFVVAPPAAIAPAPPAPLFEQAFALARTRPARKLVETSACSGDARCGISLGPLARAPDGSYFVGGLLFGTSQVAGRTFRPKQRQDAVVVHFSSAGAALGARQFSAGGASRIDRLAVAADGTLLLDGRYERSLSVGGRSIVGHGNDLRAFLLATPFAGAPFFLVDPGFGPQQIWFSDAGESCLVGATRGATAIESLYVTSASWPRPPPPGADDVLTRPRVNEARCYDRAGQPSRRVTFGGATIVAVGPRVGAALAVVTERRDPAQLDAVDEVALLDEARLTLGPPTELARAALRTESRTPFDPKTRLPTAIPTFVLQPEYSVLSVTGGAQGTYAMVDSAKLVPQARHRYLARVEAGPSTSRLTRTLLELASGGGISGRIQVDDQGLPVVTYSLSPQAQAMAVGSPDTAYLVARLTADLQLASAEIVLDPHNAGSDWHFVNGGIVRIASSTIGQLPALK